MLSKAICVEPILQDSNNKLAEKLLERIKAEKKKLLIKEKKIRWKEK